MKETKWHLRFLDLARHVASWSKDRSTKVGAVAIGPNREVCSVGYNGFPRGVDDCLEDRHNRPAKYAWTEHAERNLIYNATRVGVCLKGCVLYCTHFPCPDCARGIIQAGFSELVIQEDRSEESKPFRERTHESHFLALEMLEESGVRCSLVCKTVNDLGKENMCVRDVVKDDLMP